MSYARSRRADFTRRCELHNDVTTAIILCAFLHGGRTIVAATRYNRDYDCSDSLDAPGQPPRPTHPGSLSPRRHCRCPLARLRGRHPAGHPTLSARHRTPSPHHRNAPASTTAPCCSCRARGPRALCAASIIKARVMGVPKPPAIERLSRRARSRRMWRACPRAPGPARARSDRRRYPRVTPPVARAAPLR